MKLRICNYLAASYLLEKEPAQWDTLAILDSRSKATDFVQMKSARHLFLRFDDVDQSAEGRRSVTSNDVAEGLAFAQGSKQLLVTCRAGQSRSAAMAYLIACREQYIEAATSLIDPTRHIPNLLVVRLGAAVLDMPHVLEAFEHWRRTYRRISLSDHYDEIEREFDTLVGLGASNKIVAE